MRFKVFLETKMCPCGKANPDNAAYCHDCGQPLPRHDVQIHGGQGQNAVFGSFSRDYLQELKIKQLT